MKKNRRKFKRPAQEAEVKQPPPAPPPPVKKNRWPLLILVALVLYWPLAFLATHAPVDKIEPVVGAMRYDKFYHFGAYTLLGAILTLFFSARYGFRRRWALYAIAIAAGYGIIDELTQKPFGRTPDINDWVADLIGATCGATSAAIIFQSFSGTPPVRASDAPRKKKRRGSS
jgi:VanZ family protein